jgi:hypothetical protein
MKTNGIQAANYTDAVMVVHPWKKAELLAKEIDFFPKLMTLQGDASARKIIQQNINEVAMSCFRMGRIDFDTEADYNALA